MALTINIQRKKFIESLAMLQNVTNKKGAMSVLTNVLIRTGNDTVEFTGTDLEVGIRKTCPAEIVSEGEITLPSRKMFEIIRETSADLINIEEIENNWVHIRAGSSDYKIAGIASEEYPAFPEYDEENLQELPAEVLIDLVNKTSFAIAHESESQYNLTCALLEKDTNEEGKHKLRMVSSDSHRLALMEREVEEDLSEFKIKDTTLIPRKGIMEIKKFCEESERVFLGFDEKQAILKTEDSILIIKLMNGEFPEYQGLAGSLNKEQVMVVEREYFLNSMKRMNIFTEDRFHVVKIELNDSKIIVTSQSADIGNAKDEIPVNFSRDPFHVFFNGKYYVEALQALDCDQVNLNIASEKSPCIITADDEAGFFTVIMPMKL